MITEDSKYISLYILHKIEHRKRSHGELRAAVLEPLERFTEYGTREGSKRILLDGAYDEMGSSGLLPTTKAI